VAIVAKSSIQFDICNKPSDNMRGGPIVSTQTQFTQTFSADLLLDDATVDKQVSMQGAVRAQQLFLWSDQAVEIKLVVYGSNLASTRAFQLIPNVPSLMSVQNIAEIYVTNTTGLQAKVSVQGAGI
jgi:hypothetical protein